MIATVRCWPHGRVTQALKKSFDAPPLEGDVFELTNVAGQPDAEFVVRSRRFDADGHLHLRAYPFGDTQHWQTEAIVAVWERAAR